MKRRVLISLALLATLVAPAAGFGAGARPVSLRAVRRACSLRKVAEVLARQFKVMGQGLVIEAAPETRVVGSPPPSSAPEGMGPALWRLEQKVTPNAKAIPPTTKVELSLFHQWKTDKSDVPRMTMTPLTIEVPELEEPFGTDSQ